MLEELLARPEGKTLEFKENAKSLHKIVQTLIAFANTAGGTLVIGIQDKTKSVIGVENILQDEERIASAVADAVSPTLLPNLQFISWRDKDVLIVTVPHNPGPFYLKDKGEDNGVYVRLGSTNRIADAALIAEIKRFKEHTSFDQLPELKATPDDLDMDLARKLFTAVDKGPLFYPESLANTHPTIVPLYSRYNEVSGRFPVVLPGFGIPTSMVVFALTPSLALIGSWSPLPLYAKIEYCTAQAINWVTANSGADYVYSPQKLFSIPWNSNLAPYLQDYHNQLGSRLITFKTS